MSQERTAKKLLCWTPIGRRPRGRPRTWWRDYVEDLSWSRLGIPGEHLSFVAEDRDAWRIQLELLPPRPPKDKQVQKIDGLIIYADHSISGVHDFRFWGITWLTSQLPDIIRRILFSLTSSSRRIALKLETHKIIPFHTQLFTGVVSVSKAIKDANLRIPKYLASRSDSYDVHFRVSCKNYPKYFTPSVLFLPMFKFFARIVVEYHRTCFVMV